MKEAAGTLEALDVDQDGRVGFYNGLWYALQKKLRDYLGIFPKWRTPPPFWEPLIQKKFIVCFAF